MYGKKVSFVIALILLGWLGSGWAAELKIAYVDIQRAINECNAGKDAKKAITKEVEKFQRLIADARANKEKEYQNKLREFQRWGEDSQNELNQKRMEMERSISISLVKVIQKLGADEGYTLVLEKNENIVLFASKTIDITDRAIKAYDAQKK
jgi:outer membrane protein